MKKIMKNGSSMMRAVTSELRVARVTWLTNVRAAMENRVAFALQIFGMMLNDMAYVIIWMLFFQAVGTVNGWGSMETVGLLGFGTISFGLAFGFGGGATWLTQYVEDGSLDSFLLAPRNVLWRTITSRFDLPAFGDVIFGALLLAVFALKMGLSWVSIAMMIGMILPAACITFSVSLCCGCVAFYVQDPQHVSFSLFKMFLAPSMYPAGLFPGLAKVFFIFVVPSIVVGGLPIEAVRQESFPLFFLVWAVGIFWLFLGIFVFYRSLRRYESGNAIGLRSGN